MKSNLANDSNKLSGGEGVRELGGNKEFKRREGCWVREKGSRVERSGQR